jgi:superfamily I DNA and/or RNA helicase
VQKGVKRTFNTINQGKQGLDRKNQDLTVKILKGGRTGLLKFKNSGALKEKGRSRTVDLRSNGGRRMRAPWTAPWTRCTGPRWTGL